VPKEPYPEESPEAHYLPIKSLNTFSKDWTIKVRLISKGQLRQTAKGSFFLKLIFMDAY